MSNPAPNEAENRAIPTRATRLAKPSARSRVSNGKDLFVGGVDGRSAYARRYRDILAQLTSDIGGDPSEAQSLIIRRATQLAVWCEMAEADAAGGKPLNIGGIRDRHEHPAPAAARSRP